MEKTPLPENDVETKKVLSVIRSLPAKSQAEMLQLVNGLRLVAECVASLDVEKDSDLKNRLRSLGFSIVDEDAKRYLNGRVFFVSRDIGLAKEASDNIEPVGRDVKRYAELMGFPETAIEAFINGENNLVSLDDEEKLLGFNNIFFPLRLSKAHFKEEVEYLKKSYRLLLEQAPYLIAQIIHRDNLPDYLKAVTDFINSPKLS